MDTNMVLRKNQSDNVAMKATEELLSIAGSADVAKIAQLIKDGADVNAIDKNGGTPLFWAAQFNSNPDVLRVLIEKGADVNAVDEDGRIPLFLAAHNNSNPDVFRVLIENGADIDAIDADGGTTLFYAAHNNSNPDVLRVLIEKGADVNAVNEDGTTPLLLAAMSSSNPDVVRVLIENGANVNAVDAKGISPLLIAAQNNSNPDVVQVLIDNGADVNVHENGMSPLLIAAHLNSNPDVLRILIDNDADAAIKDIKGKTTVNYAKRAQKMNKEIIKLSSKTITSYEGLLPPEMENVDAVASIVANTILYNLAFVPEDILRDDYTQSAIISFAFAYITQFTTPDNIWHQETPIRALDIRSIPLTLELVTAILLKNNVKLNSSPKYFKFPCRFFMDEIGGTVGYDKTYNWLYIDEIKINRHSTALLVNIEAHEGNKAGEQIRYYYRKDIMVNPDNYKKIYTFVSKDEIE